MRFNYFLVFLCNCYVSVVLFFAYAHEYKQYYIQNEKLDLIFSSHCYCLHKIQLKSLKDHVSQTEMELQLIVTYSFPDMYIPGLLLLKISINCYIYNFFQRLEQYIEYENHDSPIKLRCHFVFWHRIKLIVANVLLDHVLIRSCIVFFR